MGQILIRNVPDETIETYKAKARLHGHSLEQEIRDLLEANRPYTPEERYQVALRLQAMTVQVPGSKSAVELIREDRDR